jgi:hypothetical protein
VIEASPETLKEASLLTAFSLATSSVETLVVKEVSPAILSETSLETLTSIESFAEEISPENLVVTEASPETLKDASVLSLVDLVISSVDNLLFNDVSIVSKENKELVKPKMSA